MASLGSTEINVFPKRDEFGRKAILCGDNLGYNHTLNGDINNSEKRYAYHCKIKFEIF